MLGTRVGYVDGSAILNKREFTVSLGNSDLGIFDLGGNGSLPLAIYKIEFFS
jgi:hypothetical protein